MLQVSTSSPTPAPFADLPRGLAPLGYRNFALYWIGFAASNSGKWIEVTGAVWLLSELTASPVLLGLLGISRALPGAVLGPFAGVIADRLDQRRLLFVTQTLASATSLALGVLVVLGLVEIWHLYLQAAIQASIEAFDGAARQALFPTFVPQTHRAQAVTLTSMAARTAKFAGPAIGGISIAAFGVATPFLINGGTFFALIGALVLMRGVAPPAPRAESSLRGEITEGVRYILDAPVLSGLLRLEMASSLFGINAVVITIVAREVLDVGPQGLGGLLAAPGLGSLIGLSSLVALGHTKRQGRFVLLSTYGYAVALVAFAGSPDYGVAFAALTVVGFFDVLLSVTRQSIMQLTAPRRMRGRVMANVRVVTNSVSHLGQTQSGITAGIVGGPFAVVTAAVVLAAAAWAISRTNSALWTFSTDAGLEPASAQPATLPPEAPVA